MKVAENECWPKGGIGIVNTALYIDLKSSKNELVLGGGKRWTGSVSKEKQVVFVWGQSVSIGPDMPQGFKMAEAAVVSFEGDKVFFMNFKSGIGGYYQRRPE